jgi:hypothetical protein
VFEGLDSFKVETSSLWGVLAEARVHKTAQEVALLAYVNDVGSRAHVAMMQVWVGWLVGWVSGQVGRVGGHSNHKRLRLHAPNLARHPAATPCHQAWKPGTMEYQLEALFQHHTYAHGGCRHQGTSELRHELVWHAALPGLTLHLLLLCCF